MFRSSAGQTIGEGDAQAARPLFAVGGDTWNCRAIAVVPRSPPGQLTLRDRWPATAGGRRVHHLRAPGVVARMRSSVRPLMTMHFRSDLQPRHETHRAATDSRSHMALDGAASAAGVGRPTVLIIDDDVSAYDPLVLWLELENFAVECAKTGRSGLTMVRSKQYAAIALDLQLPDIHGMQVLEDLRRETIPSPVLVITGWYVDWDLEPQAMRIGARGFLRKPLDVDDFAARLRQVMQPSTVAGGQPSRPIHSDRPNDGPGKPSTTTALLMSGPTSASREAGLGSVGGAGVLDQLIDRLMSSLRRALRRAFPQAPDDILDTAAEDAILEYLGGPHSFNPLHGVPLDRFLHLPAKRNVANALASDSRRRLRESQYAQLMHKSSWAAAREIEGHCDLENVRRMLLEEVDASERRAVVFWLAGIRTTDELGEALNISSSDRAREVKRFKDRTLKRLRRALASLKRLGGPG